MPEQGSPGVMLQPRMQQIGSLAGPYYYFMVGMLFCASQLDSQHCPASSQCLGFQAVPTPTRQLSR